MADDAELLAEIRSLQANKCPDYTIPSEARDSQAYKNTLGVVRRAWEDYYKDCCNPSATEDAWSSIPGEAQLQAFFLWCLLKRKGKLGGKLTVQTFKKYLIQLRRLFRDRHGGTPISLRTSENLRNYVNGGLAQRGASREAMPRPVATPAVVIDILYFLWALDEHEFDHPRMRLQLSFSITLLLYFGIRPGEFIESSSHSGGNEGVFYGDLDVMVLLHEGRRRFAIEVQLRNRKGVRGLRVKDTSMALLQEFERPELCPVAQLFALALADGAFEDVHSAADIRNIATPPPDVFQRLRVRESMKKVPVLRRLEGRGKATSQEKIATCKELGPVMEALGHRAGHRERFTPYTIWRGHGGLLDRAVSAARRQQRMGHANSQTFQHYLNKFSTIDGQSMVLGRPMEQDVLDRVASMASSVDVNAPEPAGASLTDTGRHNQRAGLQAHRDERKQYFDSPSAFATAVARPELHDKEYVLAAQEVSRGRPVPSAVFDRYLQWDTDRSRIIQMFYKRKPEQGLQLEDMLEPLTSIAGTDSSTWRYPETVLGSDGGWSETLLCSITTCSVVTCVGAAKS
ncbi:hypothetical protein CB0940_05062 [Cercospora beticola]|uniref:Uncharacterized protein n=1 Tax=Cercospora beticola TaxID=122368 RepID=A0A2G5HLQ9_CERBT|nr:hypothetical protein CB0940_05062 [Cercospora beticola]PIA93163.1 hypothetical protein CB0940_05062 [Cercospora beticola]WPB02358.1 hypothetical protein RHO25_006992 [Cercospora beticola]